MKQFTSLIILLAFASSSLAASRFSSTSNYLEDHVDTIAQNYRLFLSSLPRSRDPIINRFRSTIIAALEVEKLFVTTNMSARDLREGVFMTPAGHCFGKSGQAYGITATQELSTGKIPFLINRICVSSASYLVNYEGNLEKAIAAGIAQGLCIQHGFNLEQSEVIRQYIFENFPDDNAPLTISGKKTS